jgi:regulator of sigma E protease
MAGEDPELDMLKPHMQIAVERNQAGQVTRFLLDKSEHNDGRYVAGTVVRYDLEHRLTLTLDVAGEEKTFPVHPQAVLVKGTQEIQIAPHNRQFKGKSVMQRFWAIFAGPAANFILAFLLFAAIGLMFGVPVNEPEIGKVTPGGPAAQAGLLQGDKVLAIQGKPVSTWEEIVQVISKSPGQTLAFEIERNGVRKSLPVKVQAMKDENTGKTEGKIMVTVPVTFSPLAALQYGAVSTYEFSVMILKSLGQLLTGTYGLKDLSGPVGIFTMTGEFAQQGIGVLMRWAAVLSINLGLFNLLPLPALDGGRIAFLLVEVFRGRPVDPNKEGMVHFLGFAFLMLLILVVTWNDIQRLLL